MALYHKLKHDALSELKDAAAHYHLRVEKLQALSEQLLKLRSQDCQRILTQVEDFINPIANMPVHFAKEFSTYKVSVDDLGEMMRRFMEKSSDKSFAFAKLAFVTTLGAVPSGLAANSVALGFLLRGSGLVFGATGTLGLGFGLAGVASGAVLKSIENKRIAKEAIGQRERLMANIKELKVVSYEVYQIIKLTRMHIEGIEEILSGLQADAPRDYLHYSEQQKQKLGALINHIVSLSKLMQRRVGGAGSADSCQL